ncbi:hypothetical protein [Micromonospora sp. WMMD980]|uniref:hypothetical protein n=1 Tax=Micromonospora sp. WMMD980 TaxID=3016088 RepID=UPI002416F34F|nr:hypothetical protein [Micromonospora sp. WMMD980]MDG4804545.1 hypothetical protein [Micromonospora sp. WMMD980]
MAEVKAGDILLIGRAASVQFGTPIRFRLIRQLDWTTYDGWVWLDGYQVDERGDAVVRRSIFVKRAGLRAAPVPVAIKGPGRQRRGIRQDAAPGRPGG